MKKNVVYSLAALSAIPVATSAAPADVSTIDLIQSKWQGTGLNYDNNGTVVISPSGDPIEQAVGKLQQGSYVFKYNFIETDGSDIIIEVGGVTTTIEAANTGVAEIEFTLSAEEMVTVKVSSADNKAFSIGDMSVELRFDFDQAIADLKKMADDELYRIQLYKQGKTEDDQNKVNFYDLTQGGSVDQMIQEIVDNPNYETYQKYQLYDLKDEENPINKKIIESAKKAAADEDEYEAKLADEMLKEIEDANTEISNLSQYSQKALNTTSAAIKKDIEAYKKAAQDAAAKGKYPAYDLNATTNADYLKKQKALQKRIDNLNKAIETAKNANSDNDAAYNALKTQLDDAQAGYTGNRNDLEEALSDEAYDYKFGDSEEAGKYNRYKQILEDAITELDAQANIIRQLNKENEKDHTDGTSVANQQSISDRIAAADAEIDNILQKYQNRQKKLDYALQAKIDEQKKLDDQLALYSDVVKNLGKNPYGTPCNPENIEKVQDAINTLIQKIDKANNEADPDNTKLEDLDITSNLSDIDAKFNAMKQIADVDQQNYEAWEAQVELYNGLLKNFNEGKAEAKALTYDPYFGARSPYDKYQSKYEGTSSTNAVPNPLQMQLNNIKNTIQAQYDNYFTSTVNNPYRTSGPVKNDASIKNSITTSQGDLDATNTNIKESTEYYNHLAEKVAGYDSDLKAVTDKVKDLDIYTKVVTRNNETVPDANQPVKGNTYQEKIKTVQDQIDAIRNKVNSYWNDNQPGKNYKWFEVPYGNGIKGIADDAATSIDDQTKSLDDNYEQDQTRFDQIQASIVLEELMASVDQQIKDATDRLTEIENAQDTDPFTQGIQDDRAKLQEKLAEIKEAVDNSGADAALASDTDIEDDIAAIDILSKASAELELLKDNPDEDELDITKLEKRVDDAQKNFAANKAMTDLWKKVKNALDKAKTDAQTEDPDAGTKHWQDPVLKGYEDQLNTIKENIEKYNADGDAVKYKDAVTQQLKDLRKDINAVKQQVINNLDCYEGDADKEIKGLLAYEQDVQNAFDEVSFKIASMDISSTRDDYQAELTEKKNELIRRTTSIRERYDNGEYEKGTTDPQYIEDVAALLQLEADIYEIYKKQQEGYNAQIAADNAAVLENIKKALQEAQNAFNTANNTLKTYDDLETENLQTAVAQAMQECEDLNQQLKVYPTNLDNFGKTIFDAYQKLVQENAKADIDEQKLFDPEENYKATIKKDYTDKINKLFSDFKTKVTQYLQAAIKADVDYAKQQYAAAENSIKTPNNYETDLGQKDAFKNWFNQKDKNGDAGIKDLYTKADDLAKHPEDAQNIKDLDVVMSKLSKENVDRRIKTMKNEAADKVESNWLSIMQKEAKDGKAWIASNISDENENKQAWIEQFNKEVEDYVDPAQKLYDDNKEPEELPAVYAQIKNFYNKFHNKNIYYQLKKGLEQYNAYVNALDQAQTALNNAIKEVEKYEVSGQMKESYLNGYQKDIDKKRADAAQYLADGEAFDKLKSTSDVTTLKNNINNVLQSPLYEAENTQLLADIKDLEQEFNRFANDVVVTNPDAYEQLVQNYKKSIDKIKSDLASTYANNKPTKLSYYNPSALLPYEKRIAELLAEINKANDAAQAARVVKLLNEKIAQLEQKAKTLEGEEYDQEVRDTYQTDIDRANTEIGKVKKVVTDNAQQIMFYRDKAESEIAAIDKWLDDVIDKADADQKALVAKRAANDEAFNTLNTKLDDLRKKVADSQAKVDEYKYTKSTDYSNQYGMVSSQIEQEATSVSDKHDAVELDATSEIPADLTKYVDDKILDIENTAANREMTATVNDLKDQASKLNYNENEYTIGTWQEIKTEIADIKDAITALETAVKNSKATLTADADLEGQKKEADDLQARIDAIKKKADDEVINKSDEVPGDANGDGVTDVADYRLILSYILNDEIPEKGTKEFEAADVNKDGKVDVGDQTAVVNLILYGNITGQQANAVRAITQESVSIEAVGENIFALNLNNANSYTNCQMDLSLPEGMTLRGITLAERAESHELNHATLANGAERIVVSSSKNDVLAGNSGAVLYIEVVTDASYRSGILSADNIFASNTNAVVSQFAGINVTPTGIDGVNVDMADNSEVYSLSGRMMNAVKKGVNIIRDAAGKMKKVVVK